MLFSLTCVSPSSAVFEHVPRLLLTYYSVMKHNTVELWRRDLWLVAVLNSHRHTITILFMLKTVHVVFMI